MKHLNTPKVAVFGCGYWGRNLVRNFHQLGALAIVCDASKKGRATAAEIAPSAQIVSREDEALVGNVDGVVIATPADTHHNIACRALHAGKDVLVEKPLALSYKQGAAVVNLARRLGRIMMVGHVLEYHPAVSRLSQLVSTGILGDIRYLYSHRLSLGKIRREENILWSFAPHDVAVILRLVGNLPIQVTTSGGSYVQPNVADVTITNLLFDNGVRAHIHVSWLHPFKEQRLVVIGSRQMASMDDVAKRLILYDQRVEVQEGEPIPVRGRGDEVPFAGDEPLRLECQAFLDAIKSRIPPLTDGRSALRVMQVLQAAQYSLLTNGHPVHLAYELDNEVYSQPHR